jgi:hypothetical protein
MRDAKNRYPPQTRGERTAGENRIVEGFSSSVQICRYTEGELDETIGEDLSLVPSAAAVRPTQDLAPLEGSK